MSSFAVEKDHQSSKIHVQVLCLHQGLQRTTVLKTFLQLVSFGTLRTAACRADAPLLLWLSEYAADSFRVTVRQNLSVFATSAKRVKRSSKSSTTLRYQWLETSMKACWDFSSLNPCM